MGRTLAIILNHNLPELTDLLYDSLNGQENDEYDLFIMDNGSRPDLQSASTSIYLEKNIFWGGALNEAFKIVLENQQYDSLLFMNNDIEINGNVFIGALRKELFQNNFAIVTPCIAGKPNPWKQMQNWSSGKTRIVKWIDNQSPLIHRKLIEEIGQFDDSLIYGWGQELICYDVCSQNNWHIGVCDFITMIHYGQQTFHTNRLFSLDLDKTKQKNEEKPLKYEEFAEKAKTAWIQYFKKDEEKFNQLVQYGYTYGVQEIETF